MPINLQLTASKKPGECKAVATGSDTHTLTPVEATTFGFDKTALIKEAIGKMCGKVPDDYWLQDPTPQGASNGAKPEYANSYKLFGWQPVITTLTVKSAEFIGVNKQPVIAYHVPWINNNSHPVTFTASMAVNKTQSTSNSWTYSDKLSVGQKITYKVTFGGPAAPVKGEIGGETSFGYEHQWGETKTETQTVMVGVNASASSSVPARSAETAYLFSTLGEAKFRITYQANLSGVLAYQHVDWYDGHRYRSCDPKSVLGQAGLPTSVTVTEDITVGFYSDATVEVSPGKYNPKKKPGKLSP